MSLSLKNVLLFTVNLLPLKLLRLQGVAAHQFGVDEFLYGGYPAMMSLERIEGEISSLHGSTISLASGNHRYRFINDRQRLQNGDQVNLGNATTSSPGDNLRLNETTQGQQAVKQKPRSTGLHTILTDS